MDKETSVFKTVFPSTTNHQDTLFGGLAMQWMDETAFIAATRYSRQRFVTVASDKIEFKQAIPAGTFVELKAKVVKIGNTSLQVEVVIYTEQMYSEERVLSVVGLFTLVALDENKKPTLIIKPSNSEI